MAGENRLDLLQEMTVTLLDRVRRDALQAGLKPLKQYEQIQSRVRLAAATAATVEEWATTVARGLQVSSLSSSSSSALRDLVDAVRDASVHWKITLGRAVARWLDMIERETGYIIALLRARAEERRECYDEVCAIDATTRGPE